MKAPLRRTRSSGNSGDPLFYKKRNRVLKRLISLCGVFLAMALIVPSVITLTYKTAVKAPEHVPVDTVRTEEGLPHIPEELAPETEPSETEYPVKTYSGYQTYDEFADRYLYLKEYVTEWQEDEERMLGAVTDTEETSAAPETSDNVTTVPETTAPTTTAPVTTAPETTAPVTTAPVTTAPETTVPETTAPSNDPDENTSGGYVGCDAKYIKVYIKSTGKYETMLMGDYIVGVIAAEMPLRYGIEALKAQAVASRTFAIYKSQSSSYYHSSPHGPEGADVCTSSGHCQSYRSYESALASWSDKEYTREIYAKIKQAVIETSGIIITWEGKPVEAVFHACSYGMTDSMANVWGGGLPCLTGVTTPETKDTYNVYSQKKYTSAEVKKKVLSRDSDATFPDDPADWMSITLNENGRVKILRVGSASFSGQSSKSLFSLAATNYTVKYDRDSDTFIFDVYGWGHGVGMSQYGAGIYAEQGKDYKFIIKHYYSGADLTLWK